MRTFTDTTLLVQLSLKCVHLRLLESRDNHARWRIPLEFLLDEPQQTGANLISRDVDTVLLVQRLEADAFLVPQLMTLRTMRYDQHVPTDDTP